MPDWMSHILIGLILCEIFNIRKKSLVLLGALMPDLISKFFLLSFYSGFSFGIGLDSFHTPIVTFLLAVFIAPLFRYDRLKTTLLITLGLATHFLSDLTIRHFTSGMRLLFPLSMVPHRLDWIWPEQSIYVLIATFAVYYFIKVIKNSVTSKVRI